MPVRSRRFARLPQLAIRLGATLAFVARVALAVSAIAEGREGIGLLSQQVGAPGAPAQYVHNEATCPACAAQALHGATPVRLAGLAVVDQRSLAPLAIALAVPSRTLTSNLHSRAPPSVI